MPTNLKLLKEPCCTPSQCSNIFATGHEGERQRRRLANIMTGDARAGDGSTGDVTPGAHELEARELEMRVWSASGDVVAGGGSAGDVPAGVHLETRELEI
ncbi:hypothetical protein EDD18DRAFT_1350694 [Armillaria luteobubalina]|uniref:Uncharacterized protein n=1 Tax=Armillaria luteobubalina TaxID=153913 RepID=A0AA39QB51_9AGAR|nr:hypothetical protein EDD18DRAFT_1350694 [Armillaria luteobubalina]